MALYRAWHHTPFRAAIHTHIAVVALLLASAAVLQLGIQAPVQAATGIFADFPFQGRLTNPDGTVVANGNYDAVFQLYTVDTGGSPVWTEAHTGGNQVSTIDGIFNTMLGSITTLGGIDFNQDEYWLGITVGSDSEMTPRIRLGSAPYAFNSDKLDGISGEAFLQLPGQAGGQTAYGGTAASENLVLRSTSNATKGSIILGDDGTTPIGIGLADPFQSILGSVSLGGGGIHVDTGSDTARVLLEGNDPSYELINNTGGADQKWTELFQSTSGYFGIFTRDDAGVRLQPSNANAAFAIDNATGYAGVGVSNPNARLQVLAQANDTALAVSGYSLTGTNTQSLLDLSGTWNVTSPTAPTAVKLDITDTSSGESAKLVDLQVGGSSRFRVYKNGSEAITTSSITNTSNPSTALDIQPTWNNVSAPNNAIRVNVINTASLSYAKLLTLQVGGSERFGVSRDGTIAITPQTMDASTSTTLIDSAATWNQGGTSFNGLKLNVTDTSSLPSSKLLNLQVGSTDRFTVTKGARVHINTSTSTLSDNSPALQIDTTWNHGGVTHTGVQLNVTNTASAAGSKVLEVAVGGSDVLTIQPSGSLTLGTNAAATGQLQLPNNQSISARNAANSADIALLKLNASDKAEVGGDLTLSSGDYYDTTIPSAVSSTTLCISGGGQIGTCTSDARLKTNIQDIGSGLDVIEQLSPKTFDFISGQTNQSGFLAQEVQQILPGAVTKDTGDDYLSLNYSNITAYAVKAIQELNQKVDNLPVVSSLTNKNVTVATLTTTSLHVKDAATISSLHVTGGAVVDGTLAVAQTLTVGTDLAVAGNVTIAGILKGNEKTRGIDVAVAKNGTSYTVTGLGFEKATPYAVNVTPNWITTFSVTNKTEDGFTVTFAQPAPDNASFDYFIEQ